MTSQALVAQHRQELQKVQFLANRDLVEIYSGLPRNPAAALALLIKQLPELTSMYGDIAATLAADWYERVREAAGATGHYSARMSTDFDIGKAIMIAKWGSGPLFETGELTYERSQSLVSGASQRLIADQARDTEILNADTDKKATGRWSRDARGTGCAFCLMLATRGPVYTSRDRGDFNAHDKCYCVAVPDFDDYEEPSHVAAFRESYTDARSEVGGDRKDILSELRTVTGAA